MLTRISSQGILCMLTVLLVASVCSAKQPAARAPQTPTPPAVAPEAIAALQKMGAFLRTLKAFTIHADTSTDEVLTDTGQKIQFGSVVGYSFRSPDRLRADVTADRKQRQFFYDGHTLTLYSPREQYYASVPAPPTIRKTLEFAAQRYGLEVPLADLFFWGTDEAVVYTTAADNSRSTRIRSNALISPLSVRAWPWYQLSFATNSGLSLWWGSSSCSAGWARTPPLAGASRSRHRSPSDANAPLHPKRLRA
jgi:hypothetical protein